MRGVIEFILTLLLAIGSSCTSKDRKVRYEMDKNKADLYDKINQVDEEPDYEWLSDVARGR